MNRLWRVTDAVLAIGAGLLAASVVLVMVGVDDTTPFETFAFILPAQEVATFGAFYLLARRNGSTAPLRDLEIPAKLQELWLVGVGFFLAIVATASLVLLTDIDEAPQEISRLANDAVGLTALLAFVGTVVAAPLIEEIVFRGVLLRGLGHHMPSWVAIVVSSAAFAAFHFGGPDTLVVLPPLFALAVVLAVVANSRGVGAAIFVHSGFNLLAALSFLV